MDSNYVIDRLKSTPFKYPTVNLLKTRIAGMDEDRREMLLSALKKQIYLECNLDIQHPLEELIYRLPAAS